MGSVNRRAPSPAMIVAVIALVFAVAGTAVAAVATVSALSKKEKKQIKRIADREVKKFAPGLSVKSADSAKTADSAKERRSMPTSSEASPQRTTYWRTPVASHSPGRRSKATAASSLGSTP